MPQNMLRTGLAKGADLLIEHAADPVRYSRGGDSVVVRAAYGEKMLRLMDADGGIRIEWVDLDFCIRASDLVLAGEAIEPERGDQISVTGDDGTIRIYEVLPMDGDQPFRSIHLGAMYRVHAKLVGSERPC